MTAAIDQEREHRVEEGAVVEHGVVDRELQAAEVRLAADRRDQRRDESVDERRHDRAERGADDDGDGEVDDVAAQDELAKLFQHRRVVSPLVSRRCAVSSRFPRARATSTSTTRELGGIKLDRFLFSSVVYPADYGFFPDTEGEDGDALDAIMLVDKPTFPGCVVEVRPIAVLRMKADEGSDDKVVCVPLQGPRTGAELETLDDIPRQLRREIEHFFSIYKRARGPRASSCGLRGPRRGRAPGRRGARALQ